MWLSRIGFRCVSPGEKTKQRAETSDTLACNCRHGERRAERGGGDGTRADVSRASCACLRLYASGMSACRVCVCAGRAGVLACWRACLRAFVVACACARARARARARIMRTRAPRTRLHRVRGVRVRARACACAPSPSKGPGRRSPAGTLRSSEVQLLAQRWPTQDQESSRTRVSEQLASLSKPKTP